MDTYTVCVVVLVALAGVGSAAVPAAVADDSPPPPPAAFYGDLEIGGDPAPAGTEIVAEIDGEERGNLVTSESGSYGGPGAVEEKLVVDGADGDEGATVAFYVDGQAADQTATWEPGSSNELNLSVPAAGTGALEVVDVDVSDAVSSTEPFEVTATVENVGDARIDGDVEYRLATAGIDLDANATVDVRTVDLEPDEETTVTFAVDGVPAGAYDHGAFAGDDELTASLSVYGDADGSDEPVVVGDVTDDGEVDLADVIRIQQHIVGLDVPDPFVEDRADLNRDGEIELSDVILTQQFVVGLLDGPDLEVADLERAENGAVEATIENVGDVGAVEDAGYRLATAGTDLDAGTTVDVRSVDLGPGESATVTFEGDDLPAGEYDHGVFTSGDELTAPLSVDDDFALVVGPGAPVRA